MTGAFSLKDAIDRSDLEVELHGGVVAEALLAQVVEVFTTLDFDLPRAKGVVEPSPDAPQVGSNGCAARESRRNE